jgi:hypothetical protein
VLLKSPPDTWIFLGDHDVDYVLARLGLRIVPRLLEIHAAGKVNHQALFRIRAPYVVRVAASRAVYGWLDSRLPGCAWLLAEQALALPVLLHVVLTDADPNERRHARFALRWMTKRDRGAKLRTIAESWGVAGDVDSVLAPSVHGLQQKVTLPKAWGAFDPPRLASGEPLPDALLPKLLGFFASEPEPEHPFTQRVLGAFEPASLRQWVDAVERTWTTRGSALSHLWLLHATALVHGDGGLRRIGAFSRSHGTSSNRNERTRSGRAIEVLTAAPGIVAIAQLADIALLSKADWARVRADAGMRIRLLETEEDLDELLDRAVPDLGLEGEGVVLDYGPRRFTARLTPELKVVVRDESGERLTELPAPRKTDDNAKAKDAALDLRSLRKDAEAVLAVQRGRFEHAMREGRRWTLDAFRAHVLNHPLLGVLAQGLVWGAWTSGARGLVPFRVAEDLSLADADDRALVLDGGAVSLLHPLELSDAARRAWAARLRDYAIIPPFAQLEREVFEVSPAPEIATCAGWVLPAGAIIGLLREGWKPRYGSGLVEALVRNVDRKGQVRVAFKPGLVLAEAGSSDPQTLYAMTVSPELVSDRRAPIRVSELLRDLYRASKKGGST